VCAVTEASTTKVRQRINDVENREDGVEGFDAALGRFGEQMNTKAAAQLTPVITPPRKRCPAVRPCIRPYHMKALQADDERRHGAVVDADMSQQPEARE